MKHRRIINDVSFSRFIKELIFYIKKYPDAKLEDNEDNPSCGDDSRCENAFMFSCVIVYETDE